MTPQQFIKKWERSLLTERAAAQSHFNDLCSVLGQPTPTDADPDGTWYSFEKGAKKITGGGGWADVWKRGHFAWEYKGRHKNLTVALTQLQHYALALENPPLLIVSDMDVIEVHTNFTNTVHEIHVVPLAELGKSENLELLRRVFTDPERLRPGTTTVKVTEEAASNFAKIAQSLRDRGYEPQRVAHFLNKLLFSFFAEDVGLLPLRLMHRLLDGATKYPESLEGMLKSLFGAMTNGGPFGADVIEWFNGGLFDGDDTLVLTDAEIKLLRRVAGLDWSNIEPSIFGTLFERGLDPSKRSQLGAHYTDAGSIMRLVRPTIEEPLLAEWGEVRKEIAGQIQKLNAAKGGKKMHDRLRREAEEPLVGFLQKLKTFRVLDPACGSGNFLYLALQTLKDIEHRANLEAEELGLEPHFPEVDPSCLFGIELNSYAAELARVTIWIGEIQWMLSHGYQPSKHPVLKNLNQIECKDAVMSEGAAEPEWPEVDVIVGNPPFLGDKKMLGELGEKYATALRSLYKGRVPGSSDLVCYWFEKARAQIVAGNAKVAGLVATQAIRGGNNRAVLDRIAESQKIFNAWADEPWINEGAAVRVSLLCFAPSPPVGITQVDGNRVGQIFPDLTAAAGGSKGVNLTISCPLAENEGVAFQGPVKVGQFDVRGELARQWLTAPNPHGKPNSDVLRPWANGQDLTKRPSDTWIIDFGASRTESEAALYEKPFEHVAKYVRPQREQQRDAGRKARWWLHGRTGDDIRAALSPLTRYIATSRVSKHRFFVRFPVAVWPDSRLYAIAREDDTSFGILHSRIHEVWSLANASIHGDGSEGGRPTYNAKSCFETFPFPDGLTPNTAACMVFSAFF